MLLWMLCPKNFPLLPLLPPSHPLLPPFSPSLHPLPPPSCIFTLFPLCPLLPPFLLLPLARYCPPPSLLFILSAVCRLVSQMDCCLLSVICFIVFGVCSTLYFVRRDWARDPFSICNKSSSTSSPLNPSFISVLCLIFLLVLSLFDSARS